MPLVEPPTGPLKDGFEYAFVVLTDVRDSRRKGPFRTADFSVRGVYKDLSDANRAAKRMCSDWPQWKEFMDAGRYHNRGVTDIDADETDIFCGKKGIQEWRRTDGGLHIYMNSGTGDFATMSVVPQRLQPSSQQKEEPAKRQAAEVLNEPKPIRNESAIDDGWQSFGGPRIGYIQAAWIHDEVERQDRELREAELRKAERQEANRPRKRPRYIGDSEFYQDERELLSGSRS